MARIVIDARESGTTTGRYIDKLTENLHKLPVKDEIIILTKPDRIDFFKNIAPSFTTVQSDYKEFTFSEQLGFARQLYRLKADLVHFNAPQQPILYFKKSVTTVHDLTTLHFNNPSKFWLIFKIKQLVYRGVVWLVAKKSAAIITPTKFVKEDLVNFAKISPGKISVTYEAGDRIIDKLQDVKSLASKRFIMYVGRPLPHKNLRRLIDAFGILQQKYPGLQLALAGKKDGLYESHEKYARKKGVKNIVFTGFVSEGQLRWLYENCAVYVFPSLSEGFGLPGIEAMQNGAPVVSSSATCLPEVLGEAALYFYPQDINDMAEKIALVIEDEKLRKKMVETGKVQASKYSWAKMAKETLDVYQSALK